MSPVPSELQLSQAIETAVERTFRDLMEMHPGNYYYFSLITSGEAHPPCVAAWSIEALEIAVAQEEDKDDARWGLKWSYADSPFFCFGEANFAEVNELFSNRPDIRKRDEVDWGEEYSTRLRAMECAMKRLDKKGLFGTGAARNALLINVEAMPPDSSNTERAKRLNPPEALEVWLREAAEME